MTNSITIKNKAIANTKKQIKETLKKMGFTLINPSFWVDLENNSILLNAYDDLGDCSMFHINYKLEIATRQSLSNLMIHETRDVTNWGFFNF